MYNGFPQEFGSDNGPEFKNVEIKEICEKEGIIFFMGYQIIPIAKGPLSVSIILLKIFG